MKKLFNLKNVFAAIALLFVILWMNERRQEVSVPTGIKIIYFVSGIYILWFLLKSFFTTKNAHPRAQYTNQSSSLFLRNPMRFLGAGLGPFAINSLSTVKFHSILGIGFWFPVIKINLFFQLYQFHQDVLMRKCLLTINYFS